MPRTRPAPATPPTVAPEPVNERWPILRVRVPPTWKVWLEQAADARAIPVAALVRQCIRQLMIQRHDSDDEGEK